MGKSFKSFSNLKIPETSLPPAEPPQPKHRSLSENDDKRLLQECGSAEEFFAKMIGGTTVPDRPKSPAPAVAKRSVTPKREEPEKEQENGTLQLELLQKIAALEKREKELLDNAKKLQEKLQQSEGTIKQLKDRNAKQDRESEELIAELAQREEQIQQREKARQEMVPPQTLLVKSGMEEFFPREIREHLLETIKEARNQAVNAGRSRHAEILDSVLSANAQEGILAQKRKEVSNLLGSCSRLGEKEIAAMESIGFQFVTGRNHYKFKMGNNSVSIAKTPSDYRSANNLIAEIKARFF